MWDLLIVYRTRVIAAAVAVAVVAAAVFSVAVSGGDDEQGSPAPTPTTTEPATTMSVPGEDGWDGYGSEPMVDEDGNPIPVPAPVPSRDDERIELGEAGPAPKFDLDEHGTDVSLAPPSRSTRWDLTDPASGEPLTQVVSLGQAGGGARSVYSAVHGENRCVLAVDDYPMASTCVPDEVLAVVPQRLRLPRHTMVLWRVPAGTAAVTAEIDGERYVAVPFGGIVVFQLDEVGDGELVARTEHGHEMAKVRVGPVEQAPPTPDDDDVDDGSVPGGPETLDPRTPVG